jgi:hypothetical protein
MARSLLRSFVSGTRQMLTAQLIVSISAVALAGWTLGVTNDLIRERDRLKERVIQLEQSMGDQGIVVPSTTATVDQPAAPTANAYPPEQTGAPPPATTEPAPPKSDEIQPGAAPPAESPAGTPAPADTPATQAPANRAFNPAQIIGDLFTPPPPLRTVVLHVRGRSDAAMAERIARGFGEQISASVDVMQPGDPRQSGYAYYDGRQSRSAAAVVARFNDIARHYQVAPWSAQLRGVALPAQGDYSTDRLDIVLPQLPAPPAAPQRVDPRAVQVTPPPPR